MDKHDHNFDFLEKISQCPANGDEIKRCIADIHTQLQAAQSSSRQIEELDNFAILYAMKLFEYCDKSDQMEVYLKPLLEIFKQQINIALLHLFGEHVLNCLNTNEYDFKKGALLGFYMQMIDIGRSKNIQPHTIFPLTEMTLYKFMDHLLATRNILLQSLELELIYVLLPAINRNIAEQFFPGKELLQTAFVKFKELPFKSTVRAFVNCLNSQHEDIFSMETAFIAIGAKQYGKDALLERTYVDFNRTKETVTLRILNTEGNGASIEVKRDDIELVHTKEYSRLNMADVLITLKKAIKVMELKHFKVKSIKFRFNIYDLQSTLVYKDDSFLNLFFGNLKVFQNAPSGFRSAESVSSRNIRSESSIAHCIGDSSSALSSIHNFSKEKVLSTTYFSQLDESASFQCPSSLNYSGFTAPCASSPLGANRFQFSEIGGSSTSSKRRGNKISTQLGSDSNTDRNSNNFKRISTSTEITESSSIQEVSSIGSKAKTNDSDSMFVDVDTSLNPNISSLSKDEDEVSVNMNDAFTLRNKRQLSSPGTPSVFMAPTSDVDMNFDSFLTSDGEHSEEQQIHELDENVQSCEHQEARSQQETYSLPVAEEMSLPQASENVYYSMESTFTGIAEKEDNTSSPLHTVSDSATCYVFQYSNNASNEFPSLLQKDLDNAEIDEIQETTYVATPSKFGENEGLEESPGHGLEEHFASSLREKDLDNAEIEEIQETTDVFATPPTVPEKDILGRNSGQYSFERVMEYIAPSLQEKDSDNAEIENIHETTDVVATSPTFQDYDKLSRNCGQNSSESDMEEHISPSLQETFLDNAETEEIICEIMHIEKPCAFQGQIIAQPLQKVDFNESTSKYFKMSTPSQSHKLLSKCTENMPQVIAHVVQTEEEYSPDFLSPTLPLTSDCSRFKQKIFNEPIEIKDLNNSYYSDLNLVLSPGVLNTTTNKEEPVNESNVTRFDDNLPASPAETYSDASSRKSIFSTTVLLAETVVENSTLGYECIVTDNVTNVVDPGCMAETPELQISTLESERFSMKNVRNIEILENIVFPNQMRSVPNTDSSHHSIANDVDENLIDKTQEEIHLDTNALCESTLPLPVNVSPMPEIEKHSTFDVHCTEESSTPKNVLISIHNISFDQLTSGQAAKNEVQNKFELLSTNDMLFSAQNNLGSVSIDNKENVSILEQSPCYIEKIHKDENVKTKSIRKYRKRKAQSVLVPTQNLNDNIVEIDNINTITSSPPLSLSMSRKRNAPHEDDKQTMKVAERSKYFKKIITEEESHISEMDVIPELPVSPVTPLQGGDCENFTFHEDPPIITEMRNENLVTTLETSAETSNKSSTFMKRKASDIDKQFQFSKKPQNDDKYNTSYDESEPIEMTDLVHLLISGFEDCTDALQVPAPIHIEPSSSSAPIHIEPSTSSAPIHIEPSTSTAPIYIEPSTSTTPMIVEYDPEGFQSDPVRRNATRKSLLFIRKQYAKEQRNRYRSLTPEQEHALIRKLPKPVQKEYYDTCREVEEGLNECYKMVVEEMIKQNKLDETDTDSE